MKWVLFCLFLLAFQENVQSATNQSKIQGQKIDVTGELSATEVSAGETEDEVIPVEDEELTFLKKEFKNVKNLTKGFSKKKKVVSKLKGEMEKLGEVHLEYAEERVEYDHLLDRYNRQVNCLQNKNSSEECQAMLDKKKKEKVEVKVSPSSNRVYQKPVHRPKNKDQYLDEIYMDESSVGFAAPSRTSSTHDKKAFLSKFDQVISVEERNLDRCYAKEMNNVGKGFEGVIYLQLTVNDGGYLGHLGVENGADTISRQMLTCLSTVLHGIKYPNPPLGKSLKIRKPFVFRPYLM